MNGFQMSMRHPAPVRSDAVGQVRLSRSWWASAVSFLVVFLAALWGPKPGDPTWWVAIEVVLVAVLGIGGAVAAAWFAESARRRGSDLAMVALFIAGFLLLQSSLRLVATFSRFYGWEA